MSFEYDNRDPALVDPEILRSVNNAIAAHLTAAGLTRRDALRRGFAGAAAGALTLSLASACKVRDESATKDATGSTSTGFQSTGSFLKDFNEAEKRTPLPSLSAPDFKDLATKRGLEVASVISFWLSSRPYDMFQELLDQPEAQMPIFRPFFGPVIIMRHKNVMEALAATDAITVAPYAPEMAKGTDGAFVRSLPNYFILGTDDDAQYRPDGMLLRKAVHKGDAETILRPLIRKSATFWINDAKQNGAKEFDAVPGLCRFVPVSVVSEYLGTPVYKETEVSFDGALKGGQKFDLAALNMQFKFQRLKEGTVPTPQMMYEWVRDTFRNIFNNFGGPAAQVAEFRELGLIATENLTAWTQKTLLFYKAEIRAGKSVPDTMLTRLLKMQWDQEQGNGAALAAELGITDRELKLRLADSRIRANVFGTVTGAVANPEEGTARVLDSILRLKMGEYKTVGSASYADLLAAVTKDDANTPAVLKKYALEALRLEPQGEVVVRRAIANTTAVAQQLIRADTFVFVAHGSAMRDPAVVQNPLAFDINRPQMEVAFEGTTDRKNEEPQSQMYLQHGFGRHKCLGRYASELTLQECLRAFVSLGDVTRKSDLVMDKNGLYAVSLKVGF